MAMILKRFRKVKWKALQKRADGLWLAERSIGWAPIWDQLEFALQDK